MHYLAVRRSGAQFDICYQRYTLRYPLEFYGEDDPPIARFGVEKGTAESDSYCGPIMIYARRKRFRRAEVEEIWRATKGRCHICRRSWPLNARSRHGWHIDHVIPHIGGGVDAEEVPNFRIACAQCNLKKGRGYTEAQVRLGLRRLVVELNWPERQARRRDLGGDDFPDDAFSDDDGE